MLEIKRKGSVYMKKVWSAILCVLLVCAPFCVSVTAAGDDVTITIAHTNDIHARNSWDEYNRTIGFPKMKTILDRMDADLVVDAGDLFHGQAFATVENGESIAQVVNAIGYDAMTPGNHDWNYGQEQLKKLEQLSGMPVMAGNVVTNSGEKFLNTDYIIKEVEGVKVGVFGVIDPMVYSSTNPALMQGIEYTDMYAYADKIVKELKPQCDVVVCLSHMVDHEKFASSVSGVDVLVCGHLHVEMSEEINGTLIVESGEYLHNIGEVQLTYSKSENRVTAKEAQLISFDDAKDIPEDPQIKGLIESISAGQDAILNEAVGETPVDLDGEKYHVRAYETNLGRVVTDTYLYETGADVAFENGGGIRASIQKGTVTKRDIINVAPFGNIIVTKQITGKELLGILETSIDLGMRNALAFSGESSDWPENDGSYLQVGGLAVQYDTAKPLGSRVISVQAAGVPLEDDTLYTVAGNNFIMNSTDYPALANAKVVSEYTTCDDALTKFIGTQGVERSIGVERMIDVTGKTDPVNPTEPETQPTTPPVTEAPTQAPTSATVISSNPASGADTGKPAPATGDNTPVIFIVVLLGASLIVIIFLVVKQKKK